MPIGIVQSVDVEAGTVSLRVQSGPGTRNIVRARMMENSPVPEHGTRILVFKEGRSYYCMGKPMPITPEAQEARASNDTVPGDQVMGDPKGTHVMVRRGGMVAAMADAVTGFVANKATGIAQILGKIFSFDTTFFHWLVRTESDNNTKVDISISGTPLGISVPIEMLRSIFTTSDGKLDIDLSALSEINANLLINPLSGRVTGPDINLKMQTPMGELTMSVDGSTGKTAISAPGIVKLDASQVVLINSDGSPLDRVRTSKDICWYTGGPCGGGSSKVYVGEGIPL